MITQYAAAALVNEIKVLAHPASIDSIPTSAGMEDFVSMGATAAIKLRQIVDLADRVVTIELLCAAQGLDFRAPLRPGRGVAQAHAEVRSVVKPLVEDRPPSPDIEALAAALRTGLLDGLVPEEALAAAPMRVPHTGRNGHAPRPRAKTADRGGAARH
jgi:histidine ammonia-lyase